MCISYTDHERRSMSRNIEQLPDGTYYEEIESLEKCRHMYNEVCCEEKSEYLADFPGEEECENCAFFEKEETCY